MHVSSLDVQHSSGWKCVSLHELPSGVQLDSLCLANMSVQLYPGSNRRGVLDALTGLTQKNQQCCLLDADGLSCALQQLPQLQRLKVVYMRHQVNKAYHKEAFIFHSNNLQQLQGLTDLELEGFNLESSASDTSLAVKQHSNLQSLRLREFKFSDDTTAWLLAGMQQLTMLELQPSLRNDDLLPLFPGGILTNRSQLQHLDLSNYTLSWADGAVSEFLYDLGQLTQLTHLRLDPKFWVEAVPTAATYAALTASSRLRLLHLLGCDMPPGAWQHMLPFGRQLHHLQELDLSGCPVMGVFDVASLVSCCPNLQRLDFPPLHGSPVNVLAPLHRLTDLQTLTVPGQSMNDAAVKALTRLTGLQELSMECNGINGITAAGLLPLTALKQLHSLRFTWTLKFPRVRSKQSAAERPYSTWLHTDNKEVVPPEQPVWRQLLLWCRSPPV